MHTHSRENSRPVEEADAELDEALAAARRRLEAARSRRAALLEEKAALAARFHRLMRELESLWDTSPSLAVFAGLVLAAMLAIMWRFV